MFRITENTKIGGAIYLWNGGSVNYCIFDNNKADYGSAIYIKGGSVDVDYNFFDFQNNVAEFPSGLIEGSIPNNWVVLDVFEYCLLFLPIYPPFLLICLGFRRINYRRL